MSSYRENCRNGHGPIIAFLGSIPLPVAIIIGLIIGWYAIDVANWLKGG